MPTGLGIPLTHRIYLGLGSPGCPYTVPAGVRARRIDGAPLAFGLLLPKESEAHLLQCKPLTDCSESLFPQVQVRPSWLEGGAFSIFLS